MGWRMAAHLPKAFADVRVWNRTPQRATDHAMTYGTQAVSLSEAVQADVIFSCLPTTAEVEALILANPPRVGSIWVDCTSGEPIVAQRLSAFLKEHGAEYLDAPVSGQTIGAENGTLTVMVGGEPAALAKARPALEPFSGKIEWVGGSGCGFAVKAINNTLLAANLLAAAEGLSVLKAHGVQLDAALACINASSGRSMASESVIPQRVLNRSFPLTFALDLLAKDTHIAMDLVLAARLPAPVLAQSQSLVRAASLSFPQPADFSEAVRLLESWTGITLET